MSTDLTAVLQRCRKCGDYIYHTQCWIDGAAYHSDCVPNYPEPKPLTEARVREIIREELDKREPKP